MKTISVFIEGTGKKTYKFKKPITTFASQLVAKEVTVFWNFKNITSAIGNNTFGIKNSSDKTINDGYYDFQGLKTRLEEDKLELQINTYDNTCTVENKNTEEVDLKKLGLLLGFPENHKVAGKATKLSPKPVDVNHGLRYLTVTCDLIDSSKNIDLDGNESNILALLPVTPGTRLNSNCYVYERDRAWQAAKNTLVYEMEFEVTSNISPKVDVNILLDLSLE